MHFKTRFDPGLQLMHAPLNVTHKKRKQAAADLRDDLPEHDAQAVDVHLLCAPAHVT